MAAFNPWAWLRERPHIVLRWMRLPAGTRGLYVDGDEQVIVLDPSLGRVQRNATLCHEVIHAERGVTGARWLDERGIEDEVARRLVPPDELAQLVASICDDGTPVMAWEIAEAFDVPEAVAARACGLLKRERGIAS